MRILVLSIALTAGLGLAACDSPEERAEAHYQSALALMAEGDVDRALIELRNVFNDNGFHREARQLYADTVLARGEVQEAYGQYLRLIEQYPDALDARLALARIALARGDWQEVERHGAAALELAPDDPRVQSIAAAMDYRTAAVAQDSAGLDAAGRRAQALLDADPEDVTARRIVIDWLFNGPDPSAAMPFIDEAIAAEPGDLQVQALKLALLSRLGDEAGIEAQLIAMSETFPDNEDVRNDLIRWYISQNNLEGAEGVLRDLAGPAGTDIEGNTTLVRFLSEAQGQDAARTELDRLVAEAGEAPAADVWRTMLAALDFEDGDQDGAITRVRAVIDAAEPSDQTRSIRVTLAHMLAATGNAVGAREQVETVLQEDPSQVEALKLRAEWAIDADRPDDAINDLRSALSQAPRDAQIPTLMAAAHERAGNTELAGERLASAVEISNNRAAESLRYARFLIGQGRAQVARTVVGDALRQAPFDLDLITMAGDLALEESDMAEVGRLLDRLSQIGTPEAEQLRTDLQTAQLVSENRLDETTRLLESEIALGGDSAVRASAILAIGRIRAGQPEEALAGLRQAVEEQPDAPSLRLLLADLLVSQGQIEASETELRTLLGGAPGNVQGVTRLYSLLQSQDRDDEAQAVLAAGLEAAPRDTTLLMTQAVRLEAEGDIAGALAIYEDLYARDSANVVVANNLASMLTSYDQGEDTLDRAAAIARRLRGREVPPFQDTYGWIEYRRGNLEEALPNLRAAAAGLPEDPLVQYHYGLAARDAGDIEAARTALGAAVTLGEGRDLPQIEDARQALEALPDP